MCTSFVGCVKRAALKLHIGLFAKLLQLAKNSHKANRLRNTPRAARILTTKNVGPSRMVCFVVIAALSRFGGQRFFAIEDWLTISAPTTSHTLRCYFAEFPIRRPWLAPKR